MALNVSDYDLNQQGLNDILGAIVTDITALDTAIDTLVAKMNLDAGITDADYAWAAAMTTTDT